MENHTGIAFTSDIITISNFQVDTSSRTLTNLDKISYPFQYEENIFFLEDNIVRLANLILNKFDSLHFQPSSVSISIESNLSSIKRIVIPNGLDEKEEIKHIEWDLANSFISSMDKYVYLKTNNFHDRRTHKEVVVIALRKDIIDFFKRFVGFAKMNLSNLSTNNLAAELCFQNFVTNSQDNNSLLFRINKDRLESLCMYDKKVFITEYEKIKSHSSRSKEEILLEKITNYLKKIENYYEQAFGSPYKTENIYLYGQDMQESYISLLSKNVSTNISILDPLNNVNVSDNISQTEMHLHEKSGFVESIGITLDSD